MDVNGVHVVWPFARAAGVHHRFLVTLYYLNIVETADWLLVVCSYIYLIVVKDSCKTDQGK